MAIGPQRHPEQHRAEPDHHAVHYPDDGEPQGIPAERVDGVGHDLAAHAVRKPQQHRNLTSGPVGDQPPVLHEEEQGEQAGDNPDDEHGHRAKPGQQPRDQDLDQLPQRLDGLLGVHLDHAGQGASLLQPGRDPSQDLLPLGDQSGNYHPDDDRYHPDGQKHH